MSLFKWCEKSVEALKCGMLTDCVPMNRSKLGRNLSVKLIAGAVLFMFFSCGSKRLPSLDQVDLDVWKNDKLGCAGKRVTMKDALDEQTEKLLALDEREIISLLGRPDENELYKRNQKFYYYFIEPSKKCTASASNNPKKLVIRFNAIGLAKEASVE